MPVIFRAIKPAKFNNKAINEQLVKAMEGTVEFADSWFVKTYKDFSRKPVFEKGVKVTKNSIEGFDVTDDANYRRLNNGTKAHVIRPRRPGGFLVFNANFRSKTTPARLPSRRGFTKGPLIFTKKVNHPGFPARRYEEKISKRSQPVMNKGVRLALKLGANKSGHSI